MFWENIYKKNLFLDDERHPFDVSWGDINYGLHSWFIVRDYESFISAVMDHFPEVVSMDNDLGNEKEGGDCLKWLIEYCLDNKLELPIIYIHSMNTVASENMKSLIKNFKNRNKDGN